jgi:hypothetical protein
MRQTSCDNKTSIRPHNIEGYYAQKLQCSNKETVNRINAIHKQLRISITNLVIVRPSRRVRQVVTAIDFNDNNSYKSWLIVFIGDHWVYIAAGRISRLAETLGIEYFDATESLTPSWSNICYACSMVDLSLS